MVTFCWRCLGGSMFLPKHRDTQTPTWMCVQCDAPHRFAEIERRDFRPPTKAERLAILFPDGLPTSLPILDQEFLT